jgi:HEAT repeat protein
MDPDPIRETTGLLAQLESKVKRTRSGAKTRFTERRAELTAGLVPLLQDASAEKRRQAAELLGRLGDPTAAPALAACLTDSHHRVRRHAAVALGEVGDASVVPDLMTSLGDGNPVVRRAVIEALGRLSDPVAQGMLCASLKDPVPEVRGAAAVALGRVGGPQSITPLVDALRDEDPVVCRWAARSLGWFAAREPRVALRIAIPELKKRLAWWNLENKEPYRLAMRRIEEATSNRSTTPIPAEPSTSERSLPIPTEG